MTEATSALRRVTRSQSIDDGSPRTISSALRGHDNALGLIRLVLALAVLVSHTFPLGGYGHDPGTGITRAQANLGMLAVGGFFAISGYLITKSGMSADVMQFLWRRILRIFPAFLLVLLLSALVLGPIIWTLDGHALADYFARGPASPWHYLGSNWTLNATTWGILDIFQYSTPYGRLTNASVINGSLWTLGNEWQCYLLVAILLVTGVLTKAKPVVVAVAVVVFSAQIVQLVNPGAMGAILPQLGDGNFLRLVYPFAIGAVFAVYSRSIPLTPRLGISAGVVLAWTLLNGGYAVVGVPAGVYFVLWLASAIPGRLRKVGQQNDISYGVYLFAFPVQQTLAYFGVTRFGPAVMIVSAAAIVLVIAWLSWRFVERPAMSLKSWGPGRGFAYWLERFRPATRAKDASEPTPVPSIRHTQRTDAHDSGTAAPATEKGAATVTVAADPASGPA
ncbi:acyltransferase family protein [Leifsonia aquatica]|uniref:acyltransferase family protein n=1 Tax=Leifsonia aquatica TaxID=144185 RepID=UPI0038124560